jgi:hypothetical protein
MLAVSGAGSPQPVPARESPGALVDKRAAGPIFLLERCLSSGAALSEGREGTMRLIEGGWTAGEVADDAAHSSAYESRGREEMRQDSEKAVRRWGKR